MKAAVLALALVAALLGVAMATDANDFQCKSLPPHTRRRTTHSLPACCTHTCRVLQPQRCLCFGVLWHTYKCTVHTLWLTLYPAFHTLSPTDNVTNGAFKMHSVDVKTSTGKFTAGAIATVTCSGEMESDANILAGTVKYQVWEFGVPQFTASGNTPYFKCTNKGCNTADPVALTTKIVNGVTTFTLQFSLTLPTMVKPEGTNMFKIVFWGVDQVNSKLDTHKYTDKCPAHTLLRTHTAPRALRL